MYYNPGIMIRSVPNPDGLRTYEIWMCWCDQRRLYAVAHDMTPTDVEEVFSSERDQPPKHPLWINRPGKMTMEDVQTVHSLVRDYKYWMN